MFALATYLFLHVPKTAGTSFRLALERLFPGRVAYDYALKAPETSAAVRELVYQRKDLNALAEWLDSEQIMVLGGHVHYEKYASIFPPSRVITFLREPLARIASEHQHACRHQGFEGSLLEFAELPRHRNLQTRMLRGLALEEAAFVGITERYRESLAALEAQLGWRLLELKENVNPQRPQLLGASYGISASTRERIEAWNDLDIRLYAEALHRLDALPAPLR